MTTLGDTDGPGPASRLGPLILVILGKRFSGVARVVLRGGDESLALRLLTGGSGMDIDWVSILNPYYGQSVRTELDTD